MATPSNLTKMRNKAVVAFLDGRRLKGRILNFSPLKNRFRLFSEENSPQNRGTDVEVKDLKGVFFVKDFRGNREYREVQVADRPLHGRKIEVTFLDGEKINGTVHSYNPQNLGFFIFPIDPKTNNTRIFVVNKSVQQVRFD